MKKKTGALLLGAAAVVAVVALKARPSQQDVALQDGDEDMKTGPIEVPLPDDKQ